MTPKVLEYLEADTASAFPEDRSNAGPDDASELRKRIIDLLLDGNLKGAAKHQAIATAVVDALSAMGRFYFHEERRDFASGMFFDSCRKVLLRVQSDEFVSWLAGLTAINRANGCFTYIQRAVEDAALGGTGIIPESYWASRPGAVYLSNGESKIIRIMARDIAELDNGADGVLFAREKTMVPWKLAETPADPFESCAVFRNANYAAAHGADLLRAWVMSIPTNPKCKPPLVATGPVGSGKTRMARGVSELLGIPTVEAKCDEAREGDFWPIADRGGIFTLDNADSKIPWLPDSLAAASTGGCQQRRQLYTDASTVTLRARAWIIVTSANPLFGSDAGLADRLLVIRMGRRTSDTADEALREEIAVNRDAGLTYISQAIGVALHDTDPTPARLNSRHPDFAAFAVRLGRAMGRERGVVSALTSAESDKAQFCLENDSIGSALLQIEKFSGTATELVTALKAIDGGLDWLSPKKLGKKLTTIWPHLEAVKHIRKDFSAGQHRYSFGGFGGFEGGFSSKVPS